MLHQPTLRFGNNGYCALILCFIFATVRTHAAPIDDPIPAPIAPGDITIKLTGVASGLTAPVAGMSAPGNSNDLFIADSIGIIWRIDLTNGEGSVFADVSTRLVGISFAGDERGLLGLAFHPGYAGNGLLYTYTSEPAAGSADFSTLPAGSPADHQSVISEWRVDAPNSASAVVNFNSARELLRIDQPQANHNAGALAFGPDGFLYIALGDGGSSDDSGTGHGSGNGRDPANPLGAILRIDPLAANSANGAYGIPADNPFVGQAGFVAEIFAYGFRNPFRMSFDRVTGQLWTGDVGQNAIEEIDIVSAGGNYGWNWKEGSFFFDGNGAGPGFVTDVDPGAPSGLIDPVAEYDHDEGIAVIGGYVYRGNAIAALQGRYVFGDFGGAGGRLFYLESDNSIREFVLAKQQSLGMAVNGFAEDGAGNLYVLANIPGPLDRAGGLVLRIDPAAAAGSFDVSGVWWDPARSGQGLQFLQTGNTVSGVWYLYDANGLDRWLTFRAELAGNTLSADLLSFTGPPPGGPWNVDEVVDTNAGSILLEFLSPFAATMNYTVDGVSGTLHLAPF